MGRGVTADRGAGGNVQAGGSAGVPASRCGGGAAPAALDWVAVYAGGERQHLQRDVAAAIPLLRTALALPQRDALLRVPFARGGLQQLQRYLRGGRQLPPAADAAGRAALREAACLGGLDALVLELDVYEPLRAAAQAAVRRGDATAAAALRRQVATRMLEDRVVDDEGRRQPAQPVAAARRELAAAAELAPAPADEVPFYRAWTERAPAAGDAWTGLAAALAAAADWPASAVAARRALGLGRATATGGHADRLLRTALAQQGDWDAFAAHVAEACAAGEDDEALYRHAAELHAQAGRGAAALAALEALEGRGRLTGDDHLLAARMLQALGEDAAAVARYAAALGATPAAGGNAAQWAKIGAFALAQDAPALTVQACSRALQAPGGATAQIYVLRGGAHETLGALDAAAADAAAALALDGDHREALRLLAWSTDDTAAAAAALRRLTRLPGATAELWTLLAEQELALGDPAAALAATDAAVRLGPTEVRLLTLRAAIQQRLGDDAAVLVSARQLTQLQPSEPQGWLTMADLHARAGNWPEAVGAYHVAAVLLPQEVDVQLLLAGARREAGQSEDARLQLTGLLAAHPERADVQDLLCAVLEDQGRPAAAEAVRRAALARAPNDPRALAALAALLARREKWGEADAAFAQAATHGSPGAAAERARLFGGTGAALLGGECRVLAHMDDPEIIDGLVPLSADGSRWLFGEAQGRPRRTFARARQALGDMWHVAPWRWAAYSGLYWGSALLGASEMVAASWVAFGSPTLPAAVPELAALDMAALIGRRVREDDTARLWAWLAERTAGLAEASAAELQRLAATIDHELDPKRCAWFIAGTRARLEDAACAVAGRLGAARRAASRRARAAKSAERDLAPGAAPDPGPSIR